MFRVLGILLSLYVVHCLLKGAVYAKAGIWGRTIERAADPWGYWGALGAYFALSLAFVLIF
jgi:hypothetical protein